MPVDGPYAYSKNWIGLYADERPAVKKGSKYFSSDTGIWEIYTGAGWKVLPKKHTPKFPSSFDIDYGVGTGANTGICSGGTLYTDFASSGTPETFSASGTVWQIKLYCNTNNGRLRMWKGTFSGLTFTFDSYTEIVDISSVANGYQTLQAPDDFDTFEVTASTGLAVYSDNVNGLYYGKVGSGYVGFNADDPPYSSDITFTQFSGGRLDLLIEGAQ